MSTLSFDYIIIGGGAAGSQLVMAMLADPYFANKNIAIIDKQKEIPDDKRWCYWEKEKGKWDDLLSASWHQGQFYSSKIQKKLELNPYTYKMLKSKDFFNYVRNECDQSGNIQRITDDIQALLTDANGISVKGINSTYNAKHVFDSRIEDAPGESPDLYTHLLQHFLGWTIRTESPMFNPNEFVMMDFRYALKDTCSFIYVLPLDSHTALIEFTLFTSQLLPDPVYASMLEKYIQSELKQVPYTILETEKGVIPMSTYPFHKAGTEGITKIGTAGSWVKPSSGYSFKNTERYVEKLIQNIKKGQNPNTGIYDVRHRYYDSLFLDVLSRNNASGPELFTTMYGKNDIQQIFKFLDEETTLIEDFSIMSSFNALPFMQSIWTQVIKMKWW